VLGTGRYVNCVTFLPREPVTFFSRSRNKTLSVLKRQTSKPIDFESWIRIGLQSHKSPADVGIHVVLHDCRISLGRS